MSKLPITSAFPYPNLEAWGGLLQKAAQQPLALCPQFPQIARRHEAWWRGELEGLPLFLGSANPIPERPISRLLDFIGQTEAWFNAQYEQVARLHYAGDALPYLRVDFGPGMLGKLFGATVVLSSDTSWTENFINDDWSNAPEWDLNKQDPWWRELWKMVEIASRNAPGNYLVCTPNLGSSADLLLNLRGSGQLALDLIDQPQQIVRAVDGIYPAWREVFEDLYQHTSLHGAGLIHWVGLWSNQPYVVIECDFNYLIGPQAFQKYFMPDIERQAATVGRSIFHLDGPGAAKHIDAILEIPEIQAVQYVPGAGNSAISRLEMLKKIQHRGRSLQVVSPASEVLALCQALQPESLAILLSDALNPAELEDLYREVRRLF